MNERCMRILDMVREAGSVEVSALAEALGVSAVTIRKDLAQLEKERLLRRLSRFFRSFASDTPTADRHERFCRHRL